MTSTDQSSEIRTTPPAQEGDQADINTVLESYQEWISLLARKQYHGAPAEEGAEEVDDLIQATLITFWLTLSSDRVQIASPRAYINSILRSRYIDMIRRQCRHQHVRLPALVQEEQAHIFFEHEQDPVQAFEYKELVAELVDEAMYLSPCQQRALFCQIKDEVDPSILAEIFARHGIDIDAIDWPLDPAKLQSIRSSLTVARRKLRLRREIPISPKCP